MNKIDAIVIILMFLGLLALPILVIFLIWDIIEHNLLIKIILTDITLLFIFGGILKLTSND